MEYTYRTSEKTREKLGISRHRMREISRHPELRLGIHYVIVGKRRHYCWEMIWDWFVNSAEFGVNDREAHGRAIDNFARSLPSQQPSLPRKSKSSSQSISQLPLKLSSKLSNKTDRQSLHGLPQSS